MKRIAPLMLFAAALATPTAAPGGAADAIPAAARPFDPHQVRLLDGPFRDAQERDRKYLHDLDADRLLHNFRINAGLPSSAEPLGGWEAPGCELRGHFTGHYLSACARMAAIAGDDALKAKADALVAELARCQAALPAKKCHPGYLSAFPESLFDRVDEAKPVWAPYYTLHKIMAGLLDVYELDGNPQALEVLNRMADWLSFRVGRLSPGQQQKALAIEHGGMNEVLADLYGITGNPEHLKLARAFNHAEILDPLARGEDRLDGKHANTQIPKVLGAAREYELTGEAPFAAMARHFWQYVAVDRAYCIGGHSDSEGFFPVDRFAAHLSPVTAETCNTYNMLKLTRHLFAWEPSARLMDFYERALYNHILASQDPRTGMMIYFATLKPGHFKSYNTPFDSCWCCTGTGLENHARYGDAIYARGDDALYVNLFVASELTWADKGLRVRQETTFPESDTTRLVFASGKPVLLKLKIRKPFWTRELAVTVNGKPVPAPAGADGYASLGREWNNGDTVEVRMPMTLRIEPLPGEPAIVALCYGPLVLAGELGTAGMDKLNLHIGRQIDLAGSPTPDVPVFLCPADELTRHIEPVPGRPLAFRTRGIGRPDDVTLAPYWQLHHQRQNVYWNLFTEGAWKVRQGAHAAAQAERRRLEERLIDEVRPGEQQSETDHRYRGDKTRTGYDLERSWRDTRTWIAYDVKVEPGKPAILRCTYWGSDLGNRVFDIVVDNEKIATQTLEKNKPGEFIDADYRLPPRLTAGKTRVTVKFQAHPEATAGRLFGLCVLRDAP